MEGVSSWTMPKQHEGQLLTGLKVKNTLLQENNVVTINH